MTFSEAQRRACAPVDFRLRCGGGWPARDGGKEGEEIGGKKTGRMYLYLVVLVVQSVLIFSY